MKKLLVTLGLMSGMLSMTAISAHAQQDTTIVVKAVKEKLDEVSDDRDRPRLAHQGYFLAGIDLTHVDIGFSRLIDNGSFSLSEQNRFLNYKDAKTSTFSFDILYLGYRFNPQLKVDLGAGVDWTLIRLKNNITIQKNTNPLTYVDEPVNFSKNRLSNSYLHIPLNVELRTKENDRGKRYYLVFGPELGFLLNGKVKQISDERGKQKFRDDYNFQRVRVGGTLRMGYGGIGLFTKYSFTDMFDSAPQKGLKNLSFGLTFGLN